MKLPKRQEYSVKDLMNDLKKLDPSPSVLAKIGTELVYYEWTCCRQGLGAEHAVTSNIEELLEFTQTGYERSLVEGEYWRAKDTPRSILNDFIRDRPDEFMDHVLDRSVDYIQGLIQAAEKARKAEKKQYKKMEKGVRGEVKEDPENPEAWNKLRLLLWLVGNYTESSQAFQNAKKLGWTSEESLLVAL